MMTLPPQVSDAERAVTQYKHKLHAEAMTRIVLVALQKRFFSPANIPEDTMPAEHRQGVGSNAWNTLAALEIIERLPMGFTSDADKIYGGRIKNTNPGAKGRWTACYRLKSATLAKVWMERNGPPRTIAAPIPMVQQELGVPS